MQEVNQSKTGLNFWQKFVDWLYLPEGMTGIIRRLTALCLLPSLLWIWNWGKGGPGPYLVPTWRYDTFFFSLPQPPELLHNAIFILVALICVCLILGGKQKIFVLLPTLVITYYFCLERTVGLPHYVVMIYISMVALCFHHEGNRSLTRRIIQIGTASCYGLACLQRLQTPGHLTGESFRYTVGSGWAVNNIFKPAFIALNSVDWIWAPFTLAVIVVEIFLTFGFFFAKTRKVALVLGVLLHVGIAVTMTPTLIIFSMIMITSYLAFFDRETDEKTSELKVNKPELASALVVILLMFAIPLRTFFWFARDVSTITMSDRHPWSFHMFLFKMDIENVSVRYKTKSGDWKDLEITKRMKQTSSESEMIRLIQYVFETHQEAEEVFVGLEIKQNDSMIHKEALAARGKLAELVIKSSYTSH